MKYSDSVVKQQARWDEDERQQKSESSVAIKVVFD